MVYGELYTWVLRTRSSQRAEQFNEFLDLVAVLPVDEAVARKYAETRVAMLERGLDAPRMDLLIAATALANGLTVVTHNIRDFQNIPDLEVEDWLG